MFTSSSSVTFSFCPQCAASHKQLLGFLPQDATFVKSRPEYRSFPLVWNAFPSSLLPSPLVLLAHTYLSGLHRGDNLSREASPLLVCLAFYILIVIAYCYLTVYWLGCNKERGKLTILKNDVRDSPGGPVVKTPCFHGMGTGLIPGQGTKILHAAWHGQKKKKDVICIECIKKGIK